MKVKGVDISKLTKSQQKAMKIDTWVQQYDKEQKESNDR